MNSNTDPKTAVVLGYDAVSALGTDLCAQWQRAMQGESGIAALTRIAPGEGFPVKIAGQVPDFDPSPYPFLKPRAMAHWTSPIFRHALLVVHRALENSGIQITDALAPRVAITFSTAIGGQDALINADRRLVAENKLPHPFTNPNTCINMVGGKVSILSRATGPIVSTITACATGITSMITGAMLLGRGMADVAICGAVDFPLVEPIVAGFATMNGAFQPKPGQPAEPPERASRPFSKDRRGFVISEGAGAVIIATKAFAKAHGLHYGIEISGFGMTSDANHFVAPHRPTVARSMALAIKDAGIEPGDVDAVNAHATSTKVGDQVEFEALLDVFGQKLPPVSANKSLIGHAMGASSAIEAILAMEGMQQGILLPTINYTPDEAIGLDCVAEGARRLKQEFVLKNAFGFGGCNSCMVFRRVE